LLIVDADAGEEDFDGKTKSDDGVSGNVFNLIDRLGLEFVSVNIDGIAVAFK